MPDMNKTPQERLSDSKYWEEVHGGNARTLRPAWKRILRAFIPLRLLEARKRWWEQQDWKREQRDLPEHWIHQLIEVLLRPQLEGKTGLKGLEIGSAPGRLSIELWRRLGLIPYGVEYTESGVAAQKALYRRFGLAEEWVMRGDLFDDSWRARYAETFDLVASFGFIEHFSDPRDVLEKHLELLRPGGLLVVTVPNLHETTWYGKLARRFNPAVYAIHNTSTCTRAVLASLVSPRESEIIHCDTLGGPDITFLPDWRRSSRWVSGLFRLVHPLTNQLNRCCLGKRLKTFPRTASTLALVAVKRRGEAAELSARMAAESAEGKGGRHEIG
jgi:2-polyprenyl-3-methyl-5-hydroxy-6-metoxy-1,4-benzoquinol methylase